MSKAQEAKEAKMQRHIQPLLLILLVLVLTTLACGGGTTPSQDKTETPAQAEGSTQTMEPTSQLVPTLAATVDTTDCNLSAVFEADVTVPDNTKIEAGQSFIKTWRVRNTGTCDWGPGYRWTFVDGDQIGGPNSVSVPETRAGESVEISVDLVAPAEEGQYRGYWQMCVNETDCFGDRAYVQIVSSGTPATPPAMTPALVSTPWSCRAAEVNAYFAQASEVNDRLLDLIDLAGRSSQAGIPAIADQMEDLVLEFDDLDYPPCLAEFRRLLHEGISEMVVGLRMYADGQKGWEQHIDNAELLLTQASWEKDRVLEEDVTP
jgi:hypothetical protein